MTIFMVVSMGLTLTLLAGMFLWGRAHVRRSFPAAAGGDPDPAPAQWPKVAVIVPVTGNAPGTRRYLASLLASDYPDFEVILVTRDIQDPAVPLIREVLAAAPPGRGRHGVSGPAVSCGQKNHNLLAGVQLADPAAAILVFCDATHYAPELFLRDLVAPLATGRAQLATGFHRIFPGDSRPGTLGMLMTALALHLMHSMPFIVQPWGGATAVLRQVFMAHAIPRLWAATVVDDMTMGVHLMHHGIRTASAATAILQTPMSGWTVWQWAVWLKRQLLYVKFCLPEGWLGAAAVAWLLAGPLLYSLGAVAGVFLGAAGWPSALLGAVFLAAVAFLGLQYRTLVPQPMPAGPWLVAFFALLLVVPGVYLWTFTSNRLAWRGIAYQVGGGGRVRQIIRTG